MNKLAGSSALIATLFFGAYLIGTNLPKKTVYVALPEPRPYRPAGVYKPAKPWNRTPEKGNRIQTPGDITREISELPESESVDINIDNQYITGTVLPKFNAKYGANGNVFISHTSVPVKVREAFSVGFDKYGVSMPGEWPVTLVKTESDGSTHAGLQAYTAGAYDALVNYVNFLHRNGEFKTSRKIDDDATGSGHVHEFLKFAGRLGEDFNGTAQFRKRTVSRGYSDFVVFEFKGSSNGRAVSMGGYYRSGYTTEIRPDEIDFLDREFARMDIGARKQFIRIRSGIDGTFLRPDIIDAKGAHVFPEMIIILEERK